MRNRLRDLEGKRLTFTGSYDRKGTRYNRYANRTAATILLTDIETEDGNVIKDYAWFSYTKGFQTLGNLEFGDKIQFDAQIKEYEKKNGYDYKLSNPTKICLLQSETPKLWI